MSTNHTDSWGEFDVVEKNISMSQVRDAVLDGRLLEAFGAGTGEFIEQNNIKVTHRV